MWAIVFQGVNDIRVEEVESPGAGVAEAVIRNDQSSHQALKSTQEDHCHEQSIAGLC